MYNLLKSVQSHQPLSITIEVDILGNYKKGEVRLRGVYVRMNIKWIPYERIYTQK